MAFELRQPAWWSEAACRGVTPTLFFAEDSASERVALAVCARCPVRVECLADAETFEVAGKIFGTRGGQTAVQRRRARRQRRRPRTA